MFWGPGGFEQLMGRLGTVQCPSGPFRWGWSRSAGLFIASVFSNRFVAGQRGRFHSRQWTFILQENGFVPPAGRYGE